MNKFSVPTLNEVSANNKTILENLQKQVGQIPNFYAYIAKNENALEDFLTLQNRKSALSAREKEVISLVTSQINGCKYCLSAHTQIAKMNGFSDEEIMEIRKGSAAFDAKLDILVQFAAEIVESRGKVSDADKEAFLAAGYTEEALIDVLFIIGDKTISNYLHNLAQFPIDFPLAEEL